MGYSEALERQAELWRKTLPLKTKATGAYEQGFPASVAASQTFYVAPEIGNLLNEVSQTIPPLTLTPELLPARYGFVWFAKPFTLGMRGADSVRLKALMWALATVERGGTNGPGVMVSSITAPCDCCVGLPDCYSSWQFGTTTAEAIDGLQPKWDSDPVDDVEVRLTFRLFAALCVFVGQRILVAPRQAAERHARKRLAATGWTEAPLVSVVELRRKASTATVSGDPRVVEWSCQWMVSGHWRQQWYPSLGCHQPIWVLPYVKGPESAPLKPPRAKVFAVVR